MSMQGKTNDGAISNTKQLASDTYVQLDIDRQ